MVSVNRGKTKLIALRLSTLRSGRSFRMRMANGTVRTG
jgi:hypothetical protein